MITCHDCGKPGSYFLNSGYKIVKAAVMVEVGTQTGSNFPDFQEESRSLDHDQMVLDPVKLETIDPFYYESAPGGEMEISTSEEGLICDSSQLPFPPNQTSPKPPLRKRRKQFPQKRRKQFPEKLETGPCETFPGIKFANTKQGSGSNAGEINILSTVTKRSSTEGQINSQQNSIKDNHGLGFGNLVNSHRAHNLDLNPKDAVTNKHAILLDVKQHPTHALIEQPNHSYNRMSVTDEPHRLKSACNQPSGT